MAKLVTFKTPALDKAKGKIIHEERSGYVVHLYVGQCQDKFVLQKARHTDEVECLTHYASGMKVGDLNPIRIRHMCSYGTSHRPTDRSVAQELLNDLVAAHGFERVRSRMRAATVIN